MPAFEWVHVQLHQQKGMISLSPPTICNSALVGAWILGKVENGEWPEQRLLDGLDSYLERDHDRALFGLPPKQKQQPQEHGQPEPQG
ncbi:hypothetical protein [Escherichia coli]|uniref:hypothetical protein n=1 Tax=Escherichia coli TaxID=562 RepID=UPI001FFF0C57|nr:hypothetical protein [Escherichia coli]MCK3410280.1 hypothetical protein [Escherichia coli]MCV5461086.1 hypothetical protein [Escherichia coli]